MILIFQKLFLKKLKIKKKYFIIDFSKNNKFKKNINSYRISIGKFGKILSLIKEKKSKKFYLQEKLLNQNFQH